MQNALEIMLNSSITVTVLFIILFFYVRIGELGRSSPVTITAAILLILMPILWGIYLILLVWS